MSNYKDVPIKAAEKIAEEFDKSQVIVITWDPVHHKTHVTTYGKSLKDCEQAADGGNTLKRALGWPEEDCDAVPNRLKDKTYDETLARTLDNLRSS